MILEKITKGNFNLEFTKKTYKHENNLRFHVKIDERFYEYAIDTWNKHTINLQCVVYQKKKIQGRSEEMLWTNHNQNRGTIETTERFERLQELCIEYDCLSGPERQESLIEYLGKFSCTDNIP